MAELKKVTSLIDWVKKSTLFLFFVFLAYTIVSENIFDSITLTGIPILHIQKLLIEHVIANSILLVGCVALGVYMLRIYHFLRDRNVPFVGFIWTFGMFKFFMASIFLMNLVSMWKAFFWIDGFIRISAALFVASAAFGVITSFKAIKEIKTPEEYQGLRDEIRKARELQEEIMKIKVKTK